MGEVAERKGKKRKRERKRKEKEKERKERKWVRTRSILVVNYQPHRGGVE